jgi:hypothetical protein
MDELRQLSMMEPVDRCCNAISINSHNIPPDCPNGYLFGRWKHAEPDTIVSEETGEMRGIILGRFRGGWINEGGHLAGYLKGFFGVTASGEHLFFGKYVSLNGRFGGIIRGSYGPPPEMTESVVALGWFEGEWFGRNMVLMGELGGRWAADGGGKGFFHGLWDMYCSDRSDLDPDSQ